MGHALRKEDYDDLFAAPPAVDWTAAFAAVEDMNDLRRIADRMGTDTRTWVAGMRERLQAGLAHIEDKIDGIPRGEVRKFMLPLLDEAITVASATVEAHAEPLHERDDAKETFEKLKKVSGPAGKFLRKQINRIENARVQRHNGALDLYYALLAFRSELEEDGSGGPTFDDSSLLGDFLRKQVA